MIADDYIGFSFLEIFSSPDFQWTTDKSKENIHPNSWEADKPVCFSGFFLKMYKKEKRDEKDEHGQDKNKGTPGRPDSTENIF